MTGTQSTPSFSCSLAKTVGMPALMGDSCLMPTFLIGGGIERISNKMDSTVVEEWGTVTTCSVHCIM